MIFTSCSFFFFKLKTAYEMRISDWSSDVCSSDLIGQIKIEPGAEDKFALVRLAEVGARRGGQDHRIEARLHRLRHKGLERIGTDRKPKSGLRSEHRTMPRDRHADPIRPDRAVAGFDPAHLPALADEVLHFAILRSEERRGGKEGVRTF